MASVLAIGIDVDMACSNPPFTASMLVDKAIRPQDIFDMLAAKWAEFKFCPTVIIQVNTDLTVVEYRAYADYDIPDNEEEVRHG